MNFKFEYKYKYEIMFVQPWESLLMAFSPVNSSMTAGRSVCLLMRY